MDDALLDPEPAEGIVLRWLVGLRWAIFGLLTATLPLAELLFGYHVRYAVAVPVLALAVGVNVILARRVREHRAADSAFIARVVALDLVVIGMVLAASGGAGNPFSALFFVDVALAAALLPARSTFALAGLAACLFAALFALPAGACCPSHPANGAFSTHLYGMLLAFLASSATVAYFLQRARRALDERAVENAALRRRAEEASRFAALGTLAAGTAHELGTPLGTIAVLTEEMLHDPASTEQAKQRAKVVAAQVERCRAVIAKMRTSLRPAGLRGGADVGLAVAQGVRAWQAAHPGVPVVVHTDAGARQAVPLDAADIEAALSALLDNALHAMGGATEGASIVVTIANERGAPVISVEDNGSGVVAHLKGRIGEPFVTTKHPGEGMGLGLYLVRTLLEPIGGRLEISSRQPSGTRVTLHLVPADA
jgi:two-component system sensor histidine kinase RegB